MCGNSAHLLGCLESCAFNCIFISTWINLPLVQLFVLKAGLLCTKREENLHGIVSNQEIDFFQLHLGLHLAAQLLSGAYLRYLVPEVVSCEVCLVFGT